MLQVRARILVRALCECPVRGRSFVRPHPADALGPFVRVETDGNSLEASWKNMETFGRLFLFGQLSRRQH